MSLLAPPSASGTFGEEGGKIIQPGSTDYPSVPDRDDLIGFVTTGNFDLGQGRTSAIGCIALGKVVRQERQQQRCEGTEKMAADRTAGGLTDDEAKEKVVDLEKKLGAKIVGRFCIVRDAGQSVGRLGRWELA